MALVLAGCASLPPAKPIADLTDIAGKWEGWGGNERGTGAYQITIKEDGSYDGFAPGVGPAGKKYNGIVRLSGGKIRLQSHTTGVTGTITLHEGDEKRVLKFASDDKSVWFEVKPAK